MLRSDWTHSPDPWCFSCRHTDLSYTSHRLLFITVYIQTSVAHHTDSSSLLYTYRPRSHITQTPLHYCIHTDLGHTSHRLLFITVYIQTSVAHHTDSSSLLYTSTLQYKTTVSHYAYSYSPLHIHRLQYQMTVSHYAYSYSLLMYYKSTDCSIR